MNVRDAGILVAIVLAGCVACTLSHQARLLAQADEQIGAENYRGAVAVYAEFLQTFAGDEEAPRVRAARAALERLLALQTEVERLQREVADVDRLRQQVAAGDSELARLRGNLNERQADVERFRAEVARLRADLERLRNVDLRREPTR